MPHIIDLKPNNGCSSFWGKAKILTLNNGDEILLSYNTPILLKNSKTNTYARLCGEKALTKTTMLHVNSFSELNKKEVLKLPVYEHFELNIEEKGKDQ